MDKQIAMFKIKIEKNFKYVLIHLKIVKINQLHVNLNVFIKTIFSKTKKIT